MTMNTQGATGVSPVPHTTMNTQGATGVSPVPAHDDERSNDMNTRRKRVKHYQDRGDVHELTFSCYRRLPLLTNDPWRTYLAETIATACNQLRFSLAAFVFMPEHVHLLVFPRTVDASVRAFLACVKRPCSVRIKRDLIAEESELLQTLTVRERPGKLSFRFWQEGPGYDRNLRSAEAVLAAIDYIHQNPVRRGLCETAVGWFWSSARYYATDSGMQDPRLPTITRLPAEFLATVNS